ncbi:uncharacterized protein LOC108910861, partial [Anoplophora glabripennis]|uniref:uncharacterized protein LOC108910861 n=1 Tax=Anoplophora glabripennis TaxID=217634 RepID=UPI000C7762D3
IAETASEPSESLSAVDQLANVMRDVLTQLGSQSQRPSTSTGFKGDAVPYFDPEDNQQDVVVWCNKIDELRMVFHWPEDATIYYALAKLRGLAETWYRSLKSVNYSWVEWKEKLQHAFPTARDYADRLDEMMKRKKSYNESYTRYYFEKLSLINNCGNIHGTDAVSCIIQGLQDDHVKTSARAGSYAEPEQLFTYLRTLKQTSGPTKDSRCDNRKFFHDRRGQKSNRASGSTELKCFTCGKTGHKAFHCKTTSTITTKVCSFCHKRGHEENRCFAKPHARPTTSKESTL